MSRLRRLLIAIVTSLFAVSLAESLRALYFAAIEADVSIPEPWPWMVDGFILAMTLVIVEAKREGRPLPGWGWLSWPRVGLYGATAISTAVQVAYAPAALADQAAHGLAPVFVLFSFECLVWLLWGKGSLAAAEQAPALVLNRLPDQLLDKAAEDTGGAGDREELEVVERRSIEQTRRRTSAPAQSGRRGEKAARIRELAARGLDRAAIVAETGYSADTVRVTLNRSRPS